MGFTNKEEDEADRLMFGRKKKVPKEDLKYEYKEGMTAN